MYEKVKDFFSGRCGDVGGARPRTLRPLALRSSRSSATPAGSAQPASRAAARTGPPAVSRNPGPPPAARRPHASPEPGPGRARRRPQGCGRLADGSEQKHRLRWPAAAAAGQVGARRPVSRGLCCHGLRSNH
ncbi:Triple functional domain protein [Manis javanica]|nr:Triple functional domain protein [Manis javanica]